VTPGLIAFLLGLFGVPVILLAWGHRLRRLEPRQRGAFWGAVLGYCIAGTLAIILGMIPPEAWTESETVRGFFGFWAMLCFPVVGAIAGALVTPAR